MLVVENEAREWGCVTLYPRLGAHASCSSPVTCLEFIASLMRGQGYRPQHNSSLDGLEITILLHLSELFSGRPLPMDKGDSQPM